jgi:acetyl-CoA synthetase
MSYYKIQNFEQYFKHYNKSVREPRKFWGKIAEEFYLVLWDKVFDMAEAEIKWFTEAKLNIAKKCIDRHLNKEVIKQP